MTQEFECLYAQNWVEQVRNGNRWSIRFGMEHGLTAGNVIWLSDINAPTPSPLWLSRVRYFNYANYRQLVR